MKRTIMIAAAFALTLGFSSTAKAQPSAADSVYLTIENNEDQTGVTDGNFVVNIWVSLNSGGMTGATLGITWDRHFTNPTPDGTVTYSTSDWQYDSLIYQGPFTNPAIWFTAPPIDAIADSLGAVTVGGVSFGSSIPTGSDQLMAKLYLSLAPGNSWQAGSSVTLDSSFVPPASDFLMTLTTGSVIPTFVGAKLVTFNDIDVDDNVLPESFALMQNYPNPFNPSTKIDFNLATKTDVTLEIYNVLGQKVKTFVKDAAGPGLGTVTWDGDDENGVQVASGMYFYKLTAGSFVETKKMVLLK